ncbi:MAG: hypothetical protein A3H71_02935 [Candidatus Sungbacteria bacterium RIFCSPLOWO2_02_FULL_48_13b]|uniref:TrpR like protein, YerC/YecD n=2 Tax=Candidatus Sungiibacteriota TaxID=1817917 RepID=A0A1G2LG01_9BACT|nr:MAG: hypothetical protein A3C12_02065 [Candidatus Sungbacteria bacterium RIFCSPHIGHO2_02_FULL_49_20]OHA09729.1 MAG: hypothetical protein A3H71_02935 [Candidatus Sungbacteria bacterium RIFCSPLOWO2_02_FULL_48_13b]
MPHISKYKLSREQIDQLSQSIVDFAFFSKNRTDLQLLFNDLLTVTEKIMLGKRIMIAVLIERGDSYFDIRRRLGVTDSTISSISERLKADGRGLRLAMKRFGRQENINALLEKFDRTIKEFVRSMPKIAYIPRKK